MANISAIKLPDNVTYDIKDNVSGYITSENITQAEYDALTPAQKSDGTVYFIYDGTPTPSPTPVSNLQNLVDGSATASVRGVGTTAESSSYTMGQYAFAEGYATKASGHQSHAEGCSTKASGWHSHAEGYGTTASGQFSHAEGDVSIASSTNSHAQNLYTIAQRAAQTTIGKYNIPDTGGADETSFGDYALIIGNGTADNARSNALTIDWNGNVNIASGAHYKINGSNLSASDVGAQATLISGTNIKTINNQSLLGSGNIPISVSGTSIPTADAVAEFDSSAHMNSSDMSSADVASFVASLNISAPSTLIDVFYPVGSYYETSNTSFNPNIAWSGTWEKVEDGRFLQATTDTSKMGDTVAAGLPNITGSWEATNDTGYLPAANYTGTGAITDMTITSTFPNKGTANDTHSKGFTFDASNSNPIYGNSTTVQPPSVLVAIWHRTA